MDGRVGYFNIKLKLKGVKGLVDKGFEFLSL
jgi:hypothetical protein